MIKVINLAGTAQIADPAIRQLVEERINDLGGEAFDAEALGYFLVIEPGDTLEAINAQLGFSILANRITGIRFDEPGFWPSFEFVEEFPAFYDMVVVHSDDGYATEILAGKDINIPDLLAMCQRYAFKDQS